MKELLNTIKDIAKQAKLAIVAGLVILAGSLGYIASLDMPMGGIVDDEAYIVDLASSTQATYFDEHGKYTQIASTTYNDLNYRAYEYVTPLGEAGYQLILKRASGTDEYIKSIGYGVEADSRTSDWAIINNEEL